MKIIFTFIFLSPIICTASVENEGIAFVLSKVTIQMQLIIILICDCFYLLLKFTTAKPFIFRCLLIIFQLINPISINPQQNSPQESYYENEKIEQEGNIEDNSSDKVLRLFLLFGCTLAIGIEFQIKDLVKYFFYTLLNPKTKNHLNQPYYTSPVASRYRPPSASKMRSNLRRTPPIKFSTTKKYQNSKSKRKEPWLQKKSKKVSQNKNQIIWGRCDKIIIKSVYKTIDRIDPDPTIYLEKFEEEVKKLIEQPEENKEQVEYFSNQILFNIVNSLWKRSDFSVELAVSLNKYFQICLDYIIPRIQTENNEILRALGRIFGRPSKKAFYSILLSEKENKIDFENFSVLKKNKEKLSICFCWNVEYFHKNGGFDIIYKHLNSEDHTISYPSTHRLIKPVEKISNLFQDEFLKNALENIQPILNKILKFEHDQIRNLKYSHLKEISGLVFSMIKDQNESESKKTKKWFLRELSYLYLISPYLEVRAKGAIEIAEIYQSTNKRNFGTRYHEYLTKDSEILLDFTKEKELFDLVYGERKHLEIIKRSTPILEFLANTKSITQENIDLIWAISEEHQSSKEIIFDILSNTVESFPFEIQQHIYNNKLINIDGSDNNQMDFLLKFTYAILMNMGNKKNYQQLFLKIINKYWDLINEKEIDYNIRDNLVQNMKKIFHKPKFIDIFRNAVFKSFLVNFQDHDEIFFVIPLTIELINSYARNNISSFRSSLITRKEILNKTFTKKLKSLVIKDFHFFKQQTNEYLKEKEINVENDLRSKRETTKWDELIFIEHLPYLTQLKMRLDFLIFLQNITSNLAITKNDMIELWDSCVNNAILGDQEKTFFFNWICNFVPKKKKLIEFLFDQIKKFDLKSIDLSAFNLIKHVVNLKNSLGGLIRINNDGDITVLKYNDENKLVGIDLIWDIITECGDESVSDLAIQLLIQYQNIQTYYYEKKGVELNKTFLIKCMSFFDKKSNLENENVLNRILSILINFMNYREENIIPEFLGFERHKSGMSKIPLILTVINSVDINCPYEFELIVDANDSVYSLRNKISQTINKPINQLVMSGRVRLTNKINSKTLSQINLRNGQNIRVIKNSYLNIRKSRNQKMEKICNKEMMPSYILLNYFDKLFQILELNTSNFVKQKVWDILMSMPTNSTILDNFLILITKNEEDEDNENGNDNETNNIKSKDKNKEIEIKIENKNKNENKNENENENEKDKKNKIKWTEILNTKSLFKLNYSLQIIGKLISNKDEQNNQKTNNIKQIFQKNGGIDWLIKLLSEIYNLKITNENKHLERAKFESINLLIKTIYKFTIVPKLMVIEPEFNLTIVPIDDLFNLLMNVINICSKNIDNSSFQMKFSTFEYATKFIVACSNTNTNNQKKNWKLSLKNYSDLKNWLKQCLLYTENITFRSLTSNMINNICQNEEKDNNKENNLNLKSFFLNLLLELFPIINNSIPHNILNGDNGQDNVNKNEKLNEKVNEKKLEEKEEDNNNDDDNSDDNDDENTIKIKLEKKKSKIMKENIMKVYSERYFDLLILMLDLNLKSNNFDLDLNKLFNDLQNLINNRPIYENNLYNSDETLIGYMNLINLIVTYKVEFKKNCENLIKAIFSSLFKVPELNSINSVTNTNNNNPIIINKKNSLPPKCKTKKTRLVAYDLLYQLITLSNENFIILTNLFKSNLKTIKPPDLWHFDPSYESKTSPNDFAGLTNLGNTCYMNSLLQQIFMIKGLSKAIVSLNLPNIDENSQNNSNEKMLHHLQLLFGHLLWGKKSFASTKIFANHFTDYTGEKINVREQMDADEFFGMFFEKIERVLQKIQQPKLVKNMIGGKLANQIISLESNFSSERIEEFLTISLDVKGKNNIYESLEQYIEGEKLTGDNKYYSEILGKKVDALKRVCIDTLPKNLIFHLKRFEYNLETMRRYKVNDEYEFPFELDMYKFTKDGIEEENEKEKKKKERKEEEKEEEGGGGEEGEEGEEGGKGNNNENSDQEKKNKEKMGLINSNEEDEEEDEEEDGKKHLLNNKKTKEEVNNKINTCYKYELSGIIVHRGTSERGHYYSYIKNRKHNQENWYKFDDRIVSNFNKNFIKDECFGGEEKIWIEGNYGRSEAITEEKSYSAYMLIYQRIDTIDNKLNNNENNNNNNNNQIFNQVWEENIAFLSRTNVYEKNYIDFNYKLIESYPFNESKNMNLPLKFFIIFLIKIFAHSKYKHNQKKLIEKLSFYLSINAESSKWFLNYLANKKNEWFQEILINCPVTKFREDFLKLLISSIGCYVNQEIDIIKKIIKSNNKTENIKISNLEECKGVILSLQQHSENRKKKLSTENNNSLVIQHLENILQFLPNPLLICSNISDYFGILIKFSLTHKLFKEYLYSINIISRLIDLYLAEYSPIKENPKSKNNDKDKDKNTDKNNKNNDKKNNEILKEKEIINQSKFGKLIILIEILLNYNKNSLNENNTTNKLEKGKGKGKEREMGKETNDKNKTKKKNQKENVLENKNSKESERGKDKGESKGKVKEKEKKKNKQKNEKVKEEKEEFDNEQYEIKISKLDLFLLMNSNFLNQTIENNTNIEYSGKILKILCKINPGFYEKTIETLSKKIQNLTNITNLNRYFIAIEQLLYIKEKQSATLTTIITIIHSLLEKNEIAAKAINLFTQIIYHKRQSKMWLLNNHDLWLKPWLIENENVTIAESVMKFLETLIAGFEKDNEQILTIFENLLKRFPAINKTIYSELKNKSKKNRFYPSTFFKYSGYFDVFRYCIKGEKSIKILKDHFNDIWAFYNKLQKFNINCDLNLQHLFRFLEVVFNKSREICLLLANSKRKRKELIDWKLKLSNDQQTTYYYTLTLPLYFKILKICSVHSPNFEKQLMNSSCLIWAIKNLIIESQKYEISSKILIDIISVNMIKKKDFRKKVIQIIFKNMGYLENNKANILNLLKLFLTNLDDYLVFFYCKGQNFFSVNLQNKFAKLQSLTTNQKELFFQTLEILNVSIGWMKSVSEHRKEINKVPQYWPNGSKFVNNLLDNLSIIFLKYPEIVDLYQSILQNTILGFRNDWKKVLNYLIKFFDNVRILKKKNKTGLIKNYHQNVSYPNYLNHELFTTMIKQTIDISSTMFKKNNPIIKQFLFLYFILLIKNSNNKKVFNFIIGHLPNDLYVYKDFIVSLISTKIFRQFLFTIYENIHILINGINKKKKIKDQKNKNTNVKEESNNISLFHYYTILKIISNNLNESDSDTFVQVYIKLIITDINFWIQKDLNDISKLQIKKLQIQLNIFKLIAEFSQTWLQLIKVWNPDIIDLFKLLKNKFSKKKNKNNISSSIEDLLNLYK
ncbi:ubiquitin carboxyl-terminal hydrolase faf-y-related [Anaeramoeba flamelloides]|uniref:Ubiquitin carboxyl-terminal hydrolase faf-y-related n=1 Tax=Anaeramoeba flamelloides TaxID=1746091 RepID=A0AAV7ZBC6_9EUKA|nr:ubiquitin carboxyl-terminal hydrolase faf-y-related [Anaeramoeba flamelloides]